MRWHTRKKSVSEWLSHRTCWLHAKRFRFANVMMLLVVSSGLAGCGGATVPRLRSGTRTALEGLGGSPSNAIPLARVQLPGDTVFTVVSIPCGLNKSKGCYRLGEEMDEPTRYSHSLRRRPILVGTGSQISDPSVGERALLFLQGRTGCIGPYPFSVAYGILQKPHDTVIVRGGNRVVKFKKAMIPSFMHPHGVLVYALMPPHAAEVVVRTPGGRVASRERGWLIKTASECKRKDRN